MYSLKKLGDICEGEVPISSKRNLRLLQLGILLEKRVRIPPAMLRKRRKRWLAIRPVCTFAPLCWAVRLGACCVAPLSDWRIVML